MTNLGTAIIRDYHSCIRAMQNLAEKMLPTDAEVKLDYRSAKRYLDSPACDHWTDAEVENYKQAMTVLRVLSRHGCYQRRSA